MIDKLEGPWEYTEPREIIKKLNELIDAHNNHKHSVAVESRRGEMSFGETMTPRD